MRTPRLWRFVLAGFALCLAACGDGGNGSSPAPEPAWAPAPYTQYVDPYIGSGGRAFGYGSAVAGALAPFGMVRLAPDTTGPVGSLPFHHYSGYHYEDGTILGFSHTHFHGTGASGYGDLLMMPLPGFTPDKINSRRYRSPFVKAEEVAKPGYYAAHLTNGDILAELTTTGRVGVHRYTFPHGASGAAVVIDAGYRLPEGIAPDVVLDIDPVAKTVTGQHHVGGGLGGGGGGFDLYWVIAFDKPLKGYGTWKGDVVTAASTSVTAPSEGGGAYLEFDLPDGGVVNFRVGLSMVDLAGARNNLAVEVPTFDFDGTREQTEARWEELLGRVKIVESDPRELAKFYTAAYHALVMPTRLNDVDKRYRGFDKQVHVAEDYDYYSDFSFWDTFRTLHPWLTLVYPEYQRDMIISLLRMYEQDGFLPIWAVPGGDSGTMIGASAELVIADSFVKGLRNYDTALAYQAVTDSGRKPSPPGSTSPGRRHVNEYLQLGYVAIDSDESATSMTLEYAASDGALSQFAAAYGKPDDAAEFAARAQSYRNHWDPETKFFRAKHRDGRFKTPFLPLDWDKDYRESTAWQYLWYVPHDPQGLIGLFGGRESFVEALNAFFETSKHEQENLDSITRLLYRRYYWAGNEPDIHTAYLFDDAGRPELMGRWSRWALTTLFGDGPDGLPGNDDCGTMSTWYLFTALGFYPVPGYDKYYVGAPSFPAAEITLPEGRFRITAPAAGRESFVPLAARLDGETLDPFMFRHTDIAAGGELEVDLTTPAP